MKNGRIIDLVLLSFTAPLALWWNKTAVGRFYCVGSGLWFSGSRRGAGRRNPQNLVMAAEGTKSREQGSKYMYKHLFIYTRMYVHRLFLWRGVGSGMEAT